MNRFGVLVSLFVFIALVMSGSKVYAKTAVFNGVEISNSVASGYNIRINSDGVVKYSSKAPSKNKFLINLKNVKMTNNINPAYKNVSGVEYVIIKPIFNGVQIEINAKNAKNSTLSFSGASVPYKSSTGKYALLICAISLLVLFKKHKQNKFSVSISPEENNILKTAFDSRDGFIARSLGARVIPSQPMVQNVRKVKFLSDYEVREINLR